MDTHGGATGGHYVGRVTTQKILHVGFCWLTLHQDSKAHCKVYDVCKRIGKPYRRDEMPLNLKMTLQPFEKWVIDFIGPIKPQGKTCAIYIITAIEYLTRLAETQPVNGCMDTMAMKFLFEHILT